MEVGAHRGHGAEVVAVDGDHIPAVSQVTGRGVLGHGELRHLVEGHVVGVVHDDEVVQLLVGREGSGLGAHTLLERPVTTTYDQKRGKFVCSFVRQEAERHARPTIGMAGMKLAALWMTDELKCYM